MDVPFHPKLSTYTDRALIYWNHREWWNLLLESEWQEEAPICWQFCNRGKSASSLGENNCHSFPRCQNQGTGKVSNWNLDGFACQISYALFPVNVRILTQTHWILYIVHPSSHSRQLGFRVFFLSLLYNSSSSSLLQCFYLQDLLLFFSLTSSLTSFTSSVVIKSVN